MDQAEKKEPDQHLPNTGTSASSITCIHSHIAGRQLRFQKLLPS